MNRPRVNSRQLKRHPWLMFYSTLLLGFYLMMAVGCFNQESSGVYIEEKLTPEQEKALAEQRAQSRRELEESDRRFMLKVFLQVLDASAESKYYDRNIAEGTVTEVETAVNRAVSVSVTGKFKKDDGTEFNVSWHCDMDRGSKIPRQGDQVVITGYWDMDNPTYQKHVWLIVGAWLEE